MTTREMQDEILRLKREKDVFIMAHSYQSRQVVEIADVTGDSFALSQKAKNASQKTLLMCGVRFMAETAKMLSPHKTVLLSHKDAGCPMAEQLDKQTVLAAKKQLGDIPVVAYINTTAELKSVCDVCVTSSSAVQIVSRMPEKELLFIPDANLGAYVADRLPGKRIHLLSGGCPIHGRITVQDVEKAKSEHPDALLLVHPECTPEVTAYADFAGSTAEIMSFAKESDASSFIIGTENHIVEHLSFACPDKRFYPLSKSCVCYDMGLTTLPQVLACLRGESGEEIVLSDELLRDAVRPIEEMLRLGA